MAALRDRGYVLGRNLEFDGHYARGDTNVRPALVDQTIALNPDVLVGNEAVARVMVSKTKTIPIVLLNASDPVAAERRAAGTLRASLFSTPISAPSTSNYCVK